MGQQRQRPKWSRGKPARRHLDHMTKRSKALARHKSARRLRRYDDDPELRGR